MTPRIHRLWTTLGLALVAVSLGSMLPSAADAAGDAAVGKTLFEQNCASCHGTTGKGDGPVGAALNPPPRDFTKGDFKFDTDKDGSPGTDADLTNVVKNGAGAYGGSPLMAPWGHLPEQDIQNLIAYIHSLKQ